MEYADFWWEKITGPKTVAEEIKSGLASNKAVVISIPFDIPWRSEMRRAIEKNFSCDYSITEIDVADEYKAETPGKFLLGKMTMDKTIQLNYRTGTIQQYLFDKGIMRGKLIWIKGLHSSAAQEWIDFCEKYLKVCRDDCLFVIEIHGDCAKLRTGDTATKKVCYVDIIKTYDVQLFNSFIVNENNRLSIGWQQYISTLAASLCRTDAEISAAFLEAVDFTTESPLEALKKIDDSGDYDARGSEDDSSHILALYRNGKFDEINHRIWYAQLQVLFPMLELERTKLIGLLREQIENRIKQVGIKQYDSDISDPNDVELGTLDYLVVKNYIVIDDNRIKKWLHLLHRMRNTIAHMGCSEPVDVKQLIDRTGIEL